MHPPVTVAIPTYNRGLILVETLRHIIELVVPPAEILVVDQTRDHDEPIRRALEELRETERIRWIRLPAPSIPVAMNRALVEASSPIVLFLDDDLVPSPGLIEGHARSYGDEGVWAVVGQVLQPGEAPIDPPSVGGATPLPDLEFPFCQNVPAWVENVMAGNLSVRRDRAIGIGGFDENFIGAAYRFETDFARRIVQAGGQIRFEPAASIRHLKIPSGGIREWGDHRTSMSPEHTVGDYYFAMKHLSPGEQSPYFAARLRRNVLTRFLATHPWWIVPKLIGEFRGRFQARRLMKAGPRLISPDEGISGENQDGNS